MSKIEKTEIFKEATKSKHNAYMKKYVENSPTISCGCGGKYKAYCAYRHNKTTKHLAFLKAAAEQASKHVEVPLEVIPEPVVEVKLADFVDIEQVQSLVLLKPKPKKVVPKPKEEKIVAQPIAIVDTSLGKLMTEVLAEDFINTSKEEAEKMTEYAVAVKEVLATAQKPKPKKKVCITETPKTDVHNVVA